MARLRPAIIDSGDESLSAHSNSWSNSLATIATPMSKIRKIRPKQDVENDRAASDESSDEFETTTTKLTLKSKDCLSVRRQRPLHSLSNNTVLLQSLRTPKPAMRNRSERLNDLRLPQSVRSISIRKFKDLQGATRQKTQDRNLSSEFRAIGESSHSSLEEGQTSTDLERTTIMERQDTTFCAVDDLDAWMTGLRISDTDKIKEADTSRDDTSAGKVSRGSESDRSVFNRVPLFAPLPDKRAGTTSGDDDIAVLTYNPPRSRSPAKTAPSAIRPRTPSPSAHAPQHTLTSPSKHATHIPPTPHRPSVDAFWSQSVINEWVDQHSPRKATVSPKKHRFITPDFEDADYPSPSASPRMSPSKTSPKKKDKEAAGRKKAFEASKQVDSRAVPAGTGRQCH